MKIAVIGTSIFNELKKVKVEAEKRGHQLDFIVPKGTSINNLKKDFLDKLISYDLVHYRAGLDAVGGYLIGQELQKHQIKFLNSAYFKNPFFVNKIYQIFVCSEAGIKTPKSFLYHKSVPFEDITKDMGLPFIAKADQSSQGSKVFLIETEEDLKEAKKKTKKRLLMQELIPNDGDYRVHVFADKALAVYKRTPVNGDFRSNVSLGGEMTEVTDKKLVQKLFAMAEKASRALGLEISGIDIMQHRETGELYFIESNRNPGWKNVRATIGISISEKMVDLYEKVLRN